ncbi:MAG TPA: hypothetical protein ENJ09_14160 [Planctomycetes bacterium]|nr:hypothetical protein [Planctomycetota bacterium]
MTEREDPDALPPEGSPEPAPTESEPNPAEAGGDELEVLARLLREEEEREESDFFPADFEGGDEEEELVLLEDDTPEIVAGRFELIERIGAGPHGELFRARDLEQQGRAVAIKLVTPDPDAAPEETSERLEAWVEAARHLPKDGENPLREAGIDDDGRIWLASDLIDGENARELADKVGALPPRHAFEIARQILVVLERAGEEAPHGSLTPENVLLAHRVPWSEDNPFGVGVRLTDHGLTPFLFPDEAGDGAADRLRVATLLAELLTGMRVAEDGSDWAGSEASASTASLSPAARRLLDRSLSRNPAERFPDAASFRAAIEETPEWRPARPSRSPLWIALALAACALAAFVLRERIGEAFAAPATIDETAAARAREAEEAARLERERRAALEAEKAALEGRLSELSEEVTRTRDTAESLRTSGADLEARVNQAEEEKQQLDSDLEATRERLAAEAARRREAEAARLRMEAEAREAERRAAAELERLRAEREARSPDARTAEAVRRYLAHLGAGDTGGATDIAGSLEDGHALATIAYAENALARAASAASTDALLAAPLLEEARGALDRAHTALSGLRAAAPAWLEFRAGEAENGEAAESASLLTALEANLASATERERDLRREVNSELEARFAELTDDRLPAPSEIADLAAALGPRRIEEVARTYVDALGTCDQGERLDLEALAAFPHLHEWALFLWSEPRFAELFDAVQPFDLARAIFLDRKGPFLEPRPEAAAPEEGTWREDVLLRGRFLSAGHGFPAPIGTHSLYHSRTVDGEESWRWDRVLADPSPPAGVDDSRIIEQHFHDAAGIERGSRRIRILRIGTRFFEEDVVRSELLDLSTPSDPGDLVSWSPPSTFSPPARLLVHPAAFDAFRAIFGASPSRALSIGRGTIRSLYAPTLGLLRRDDPAHITTELVFAEMP